MRAGLVTFEGIDGSGKSTVSRQVFEVLKGRGERVILTAEPTRSWIGDAVRRSYEEDVGALAESFLFLADRARHLVDVRSSLDDGAIVLCDRYADSTYAYQGARLEGNLPDPVGFLRRVSRPWVLVPDVTILLRIPVELGIRRIQGRTSHIRFEDVGFLRKVAANYDTLARNRRFVVVDGTRPAEVVSAECVRAIEKVLRRTRKRTARSLSTSA